MLVRLLLASVVALLVAQERPTSNFTDTCDEPTIHKSWNTEETSGPRIAIENGAMTVKGEFLGSGSKAEEIRGYLNFAAPDFVSIEMDVTVNSGNANDLVRTGIFVSREKATSATAYQVRGQIAVSRQVEGTLAVRVVNQPVTTEHPMPSWQVPVFAKNGESTTVTRPISKTFRLGIARVPGTANQVTITIDGEKLFEGKDLEWLASKQVDIRVGFFAQGLPGQTVDMTIDNVTWICHNPE